jgi:signal transduction histidine kinase
MDKNSIEERLYNSRVSGMNDMAKHIAHHWRQPLNVLSISLSYIDTLLLESDSDINMEDYQRTYDKCMSIIDKMTHTIDVFDDYSSQDNIDREFFISEVVGQLEKIHSVDFQRHSIKYLSNIEKDTKLYGDKSALARAISNILSNSIESSMNNIHTREITLNTYIKDNYLYIAIKNHSDSIDSGNIHKSFEPYFSTKHPYEGVGLSLYISKKIVQELYSGDIVSSIDNTDITYIVSLAIK